MKRDNLVLAGLCLGTFMLLLDITIVQAALPQIRLALGGDLTSLQWTIDAYALPLAALIVSLGSIADRFGRRTVFVTGVTLFAAASLACALSSSMPMLEVSRAVQGVGGAAMFATTLALIAQEFAGPKRAHAVLVWGSTVGLAVASGPLIGGLLTEYASWEWIFLVNVPIAALTVAVALRYIADGRDPSGRRLDAFGLVTLTIGLVLTVGGLLRGSSADWHGWQSSSALACGLVMLAMFAWSQRRPVAMLDADLIGNRSFVGVSLATVALGAGMFSVFLYLTVFLQDALALSPVASGVRLLAATLPIVIVPIVMRRARIAPTSGRLIGCGLVLIAAGLSAMVWSAAAAGWDRLLPGLLVAGIGIGLANACIAATALAVVPPQRSGLAAGVSNTSRLGGIALGVALLGVVFRLGIAHALGAKASSGTRELVAAGNLHAAARTLATPDLNAVQTAFTTGLHWMLVVATLIVALGALTAFRLVRVGASSPSTPAHPLPTAEGRSAVTAATVAID